MESVFYAHQFLPRIRESRAETLDAQSYLRFRVSHPLTNTTVSFAFAGSPKTGHCPTPPHLPEGTAQRSMHFSAAGRPPLICLFDDRRRPGDPERQRNLRAAMSTEIAEALCIEAVGEFGVLECVD